MDDDDRMILAVDRLSAQQRRLVSRCLDALVNGPYIDDIDFPTVMGVTRDEAAEVAASWPEPTASGRSFMTVNNALNNLLRYPHRRWRRLSREIRGDENDLARALAAWRNEEHHPGGSEGYFDALM